MIDKVNVLFLFRRKCFHFNMKTLVKFKQGNIFSCIKHGCQISVFRLDPCMYIFEV